MRNDRGFTLIELVMVITLIGTIAGIVAIPLLQGIEGWFDVTSREDIAQSGRVAMERMSREIRNTARTAANAPCINTATTTSLAFGTNPSSCAAISFSRAGGAAPYSIQRNGIDLADKVQSLTFTYYDANNAPTLVAANIRRVAIEIVSISGGETARKYSEVSLANM